MRNKGEINREAGAHITVIAKWDSALALLVARILANDTQDSFPPDNAAVTAEAFHGRSDFHDGVAKKIIMVGACYWKEPASFCFLIVDGASRASEGNDGENREAQRLSLALPESKSL